METPFFGGPNKVTPVVLFQDQLMVKQELNVADTLRVVSHFFITTVEWKHSVCFSGIHAILFSLAIQGTTKLLVSVCTSYIQHPF